MKKFFLCVSLLFITSFHAQTIKMNEKKGGVYEVPVIINNTLKIQFLLDTGASESSIPLYVFYTLLKNGTITRADKLSEKTYTLADGSEMTNKRCIIREITIGDHVLRDVSVSISESVDSPLLIGQNVLGQFSKVIIDYKEDTLILEK